MDGEIASLRQEGLRCVYTSDGGRARADGWLRPRKTVDRSWTRTCVCQAIQARDELLVQAAGILRG